MTVAVAPGPAAETAVTSVEPSAMGVISPDGLTMAMNGSPVDQLKVSPSTTLP